MLWILIGNCLKLSLMKLLFKYNDLIEEHILKLIYIINNLFY